MAATFVTTLDNPFDYWTQFDEWFAFDEQKGYHTCEYVARIAKTSSEMSERDYEDAVNDAVNDIVRLNITGNYVKTVEKKNNNDKSEDESE